MSSLFNYNSEPTIGVNHYGIGEGLAAASIQKDISELTGGNDIKYDPNYAAKLENDFLSQYKNAENKYKEQIKSKVNNAIGAVAPEYLSTSTDTAGSG